MSARSDWSHYLSDRADAHARMCAAFVLADEQSSHVGFLAQAQRHAERFELFWEWEGLALQRTHEVCDASVAEVTR